METQEAPKTMIEYRDMTDENRSRTTLLSILAFIDGRRYTLTHHSPGYECAGSMARWTNEVWRVRFMLDNAIHGQAYHTEAEARADFAKRTAQQPEGGAA